MKLTGAIALIAYKASANVPIFYTESFSHAIAFALVVMMRIL